MALAPKSVVQLLIRAKGLKDEDTFSKSDPFAVVHDGAREVGRTETMMNNLNPHFTRHVEVDYFFEMKQTITVVIWDFDKDGNHDELGRASFTLGGLMSARDSTLTVDLAPKGKLTVIGLPVGNVQGTVEQLSFRGVSLKNMDTFGKSDPFFVLSRVLPTGSLEQLYKSETIDNSLDPAWRAAPPLQLTALCSGNLDAKVVKFQCFDEDVTDSELMGEFVCSVNELLVPNAEFRLVKASEFFGMIRVVRADFKKTPQFLDLIKAGLQLNCAFSIDFTGSNLDPKQPNSLHYMHPTQPNAYIRAMIAVSDVVQEYDSDRLFPAFGFGAMLPGEHDANHFFHLNLDANPYLPGMQAVINAYTQTLQRVRLYGPTNFAPTIRNVGVGARNAPGVYTLLLILTDGAITDLNDTISEIVELADSNTPISICIIGVGPADFSSMSALDSDGGALRSRTTGKTAKRDLVQFVPMRDFEGKDPAMLAAAILKEIPGQVSAWARLANVDETTLARK